MDLTATDVLFDSWAWFEILANSVRGRRLHAKYLASPKVQVHTSILTLAELSSRLAAKGQPDRIPSVLNHVEARSRIQPLSREIAEAAGPLRLVLRRREASTSLTDAVLLATARHLGHPLVSADPAFAKEPDVVDH